MFLSLKTKQQQFSVELIISEEEEKAKWCDTFNNMKIFQARNSKNNIYVLLERKDACSDAKHKINWWQSKLNKKKSFWFLWKCTFSFF